MSFNRENVIWESEDGTWNLGFFYVRWTGDDPEWDVEYDYEAFDWVSTGHPDARSARASWQGANPGGHIEVSYEGNEDECDAYDEMAEECARNDWHW